MIKLLPHQEEDSQFLFNNPDVPNFSEAGSGKTYTTLEAVRKDGYTSGVVVAPTIALHMWKEEIEKYLGRTAIIIKTGKTKLVLPSGVKPNFYVLSYGMVINKTVWGYLYEVGGEALVLDESDALANRESKRTRAIYGPDTDGKGGLFEKYNNTYPMTGTPIPRYADGLWAQLRASHPEVLEAAGALEYWQFCNKFCVTAIKKFHPRAAPKRVIVRSKNTEELHSLIYEEVGALRRVLTEVQDTMPPLTFRNMVVPIPKSAELVSAIKGMTEAQIITALTAELSGMGKAWHTLGSLKARAVAEYAIEQARNGPVVVGYWHTDVGDEIFNDAEAAGLRVARVKGGVGVDKREAIRVAFNEGEIDVLVGQIASMNTAWNLQKKGRHVIIAEDHFSPSIVEQFIKRVWRFGQNNHVQVDFMKADHPIDLAITGVRERKQAANKEIIG